MYQISVGANLSLSRGRKDFHGLCLHRWIRSHHCFRQVERVGKSFENFSFSLDSEFLEPVINHFNGLKTKRRLVPSFSSSSFELLVQIPENNRGQFEIDLTKQTEQMWKSIGTFRPNHLSVCSMKDYRSCSLASPLQHLQINLEPLYFAATLIDRSPVTHDTDWYTFALPSNVLMSPPIGYHIRLKRSKEGNDDCPPSKTDRSDLAGLSIVKPYTVVTRLLQDDAASMKDKIQLLIKHYTDRSMTPMLKQLQIGRSSLANRFVSRQHFDSFQEIRSI